MAASIYATPPPDLSSEDTALSDASNSSQISNTSSQHSRLKQGNSSSGSGSGEGIEVGRPANKKIHKRSIADVLMGHNQALMARTFTSSSNSALLEAMQFDQSKKRRKQSMPIRLAALNLSANGSIKPGDIKTETNSLSGEQDESEPNNGGIKEEPNMEDDSQTDDYEDKLSNIFLPKLVSQLNPFDLLQRNISPLGNFQDQKKSETSCDRNEDTGEQNRNNLTDYNPIFCKECGESFDSDLRLKIHILQEHSTHQLHDDKQNTGEEQNSLDILSHGKIKMERTDEEDATSQMHDNRIMQKPDQWLSAMPSLGFPFPPEAAAAFSSGYLSNLPLLGVPPAFPSVEGLTRPPLRIFNPEAYCDLCNKEFCNKYFLKTHKANKHGIYDPACTSAESGMTNATPPMGTMSQVFHLQLQQQQQQQLEQQAQFQAQQHQQQQQQQQQQHQQHQQQPPQITPTTPMIPCDVCSKKFTNIFAMKRHRSKVHEVPPPPTANNSTTSASTTIPTTTSTSPHDMKYDMESTSLGYSNEKDNNPDKDTLTSSSNNLRLPDGFREDFSVEQEDVSFTPQPRKLSPSSQQQARDSNFSFDKLKRLGVVNPEAFCDICCKEYCNKYFLRTHKWKRHGIFVPPDDTKDDIKMQWPFFAMQTTPLNLMMANEKLLERKSSTQPMDIKDSVKRLKYDCDSKPQNGQNEKNEEQTNNEEHSEQPGLTPNPETVGLNLQKLQSMIMQLNDLNGKRQIPCHICGKDMENQYILHAHIATEHSMDNNNGSNLSVPPYTAMKLSPSTSPVMSTIVTNEVCKQCDREFPTLLELKQHITEAHSLASLSNNSPLREGFVTPERPITSTGSNGPSTPGNTGTASGQNERARAPYTITPTSSYCEICNKELCNKYFMKTHMQRMHGIEIENGAQIGGVVCNICNKELCSKYFLRVHKHNTHGIVDEGSPLPQSRQNNGTEQPEQAEVNTNTFPADSKLDMAGVEFNSRYFTHYTEICPLCSRRFRSAKWLRAHLMSDHGPAGVEKLREIEQQLGNNFSKSSSPTLKIPNGGNIPQPNPLNNINPNLLVKNHFPGLFGPENPLQSPRFKEYQCSLCSFSTPYYAFLFIHERSHSILSGNTSAGIASAASPLAPIKSESAVSIAKDLGPESNAVTQPTSTTIKTAVSSSSSSSSTSSGGTPTTTPASTPVPQTPQETAKRDLSTGTDAVHTISPPVTASTLTTTATSTISSIVSISNQLSSPNIDVNFLQEIANKTSRPVAYAVPQDMKRSSPTGAGTGAELMQPFFVQENPSLSEASDGSNRFVPALIYLPVRERISGPITVSFTLTPA